MHNSTANNSPMQNALEQFTQWLASRGTNSEQLFSHSNTISGSKVAKPLSIQDYNAAMKISDDISKGTSIAKDFSAVVQKGELNALDFEKGFGDLAKKTSKTAVEQKLMEAVETFLSPHEKNQAIQENKKIGAVVKQVETSMQKSLELAGQTLMREKQKEIQTQEKEREIKPEKKMASLGEEFGVLEEIVKSMRKVLENAVENKKSFAFEVVSTRDTEKNLKAMGQAHGTQAKGNGMSRA